MICHINQTWNRSFPRERESDQPDERGEIWRKMLARNKPRHAAEDSQRMTNLCNPRPVRRVAGQQPFGFVTQGGDRTFNNLTVVSDLSIGSQATIPLAYADEIASLSSNLSISACDRIIIEPANVLVLNVPNVTTTHDLTVGGNLIVSNLNLNLNQAPPGQLVTRNSTTGKLIFSNVNAVPTIDTSLTLSLNPANGNVAIRGPPAGVTKRVVSVPQPLPSGTPTLVLYDSAVSVDPNVSYSAGVFTFVNPGAYAIAVMCQINNDASGAGIFEIRQGGADLSGTLVRQTGGFSFPQSCEMTYYWSTAVDGTTMVVDFENLDLPVSLTPGLTNSIVILRLW